MTSSPSTATRLPDQEVARPPRPPPPVLPLAHARTQQRTHTLNQSISCVRYLSHAPLELPSPAPQIFLTSPSRLFHPESTFPPALPPPPCRRRLIFPISPPHPSFTGSALPFFLLRGPPSPFWPSALPFRLLFLSPLLWIPPPSSPAHTRTLTHIHLTNARDFFHHRRHHDKSHRVRPDTRPSAS